MIQFNRPLRDRSGKSREGRHRGGAIASGAAASSSNREFHVNSTDFTERSARFQDPHAASRQEILGIKARALAQHAEIDGTMRRFENFMMWFATLSMLGMAARIGWAWHTGMIG